MIMIIIIIIISDAQRGNGIGGKGSQNEARVLRTTPSREKQGFYYAGGLLEPIAPLSLPCGASSIIIALMITNIKIIIVIVLLLIYQLYC